MFCHITKVGLNIMKIVIINAFPKLQLLPFCFVGQYIRLTWKNNRKALDCKNVFCESWTRSALPL